MTTECPAPEDLARAVSQNVSTDMDAHVASCAACSAERQSAHRLRELTKSLPVPAPERAQVARVRERTLAQAVVARRRDRLRSGLLVGLALAAGAVLAIGLRSPKAPLARYHGTVTAAAHAHFTRVSAAPDELVVLESGTIHVEVSPLSRGERFRVRAGDGEVEVHGTAFDVTVDGGHMERVEVEHGRVEVRGAGAPQAVLGAGQRWAATTARMPSAQPGSMKQPAPVDTPGDDAPSAEPPASSPLPPAARVGAPDPAGQQRGTSGRSPAESASSNAKAAETIDAPPEHEPEVASRSIVPNPSTSAVVPPPARRAPAPAQSTHPGGTPGVPASDDRAREEERRERRDERRERHDQRRFR